MNNTNDISARLAAAQTAYLQAPKYDKVLEGEWLAALEAWKAAQ